MLHFALVESSSLPSWSWLQRHHDKGRFLFLFDFRKEISPMELPSSLAPTMLGNLGLKIPRLDLVSILRVGSRQSQDARLAQEMLPSLLVLP